MATEEEKEQQRRKRLDELELYEKTQEKLLVWGQRRFWWVIAFGGLIVGSGGYAAVDKMLSGVTDDANRAMIEAQLAAAEITKARVAATEAVANAKNATTQAAQAATQSVAAKAEADAASKLANRSVDELAEALTKFKQQTQQLTSAVEQLRKDLETARRRFEREVAGLVAGAASIRAEADPEGASLQSLIDQLGESHSLTERTAAATALGQRGKEAESALDDLKAAFRNVRVNTVPSEEDQLVEAVARAIAQIGGESALPFLLDAMEDSDLTTLQQINAGDALSAVPVWSTQGVERLRSSFAGFDGVGRDQIVVAFRGAIRFADEAARAAALDFLIQALEDRNSVVVQSVGFALKETFAKDGEKSLPALRKALNRYKDEEYVSRAVESAINAIEGKKQD